MAMARSFFVCPFVLAACVSHPAQPGPVPRHANRPEACERGTLLVPPGPTTSAPVDPVERARVALSSEQFRSRLSLPGTYEVKPTGKERVLEVVARDEQPNAALELCQTVLWAAHTIGGDRTDALKFLEGQVQAENKKLDERQEALRTFSEQHGPTAADLDHRLAEATRRLQRLGRRPGAPKQAAAAECDRLSNLQFEWRRLEREVAASREIRDAVVQMTAEKKLDLAQHPPIEVLAECAPCPDSLQ